LVSDVPVGLFLSAGLDSGTLLALATEAAGPGMLTHTLAFDEFRGTANDEAPLAARVAQHFGARHHPHRMAAADFEAALAPLTAAMDQPSIDGVNTYFVARATANSGIKVALSGVGGDELFGGYPSFRQVPALTRRLAPLARLPGLGRLVRRASAPLLPRRFSPKLAGVLEFGGTVPDAWLLRRALFMPWELPEVLEPELAAAGWAALDARGRLAGTVAGLRSPYLQVMALEMSWYLRNQLLRDADWAGMAHGLEIRTPLVDATLLQTLAPLLAGACPPDKRALLTVARPPLPEAVVNRPKTGFGTPMADWQAGTGAGRRGLRGWALALLRARVDPALVSPA
jgi:asparagine synthase (glutamine-hydrolysing)